MSKSVRCPSCDKIDKVKVAGNSKPQPFHTYLMATYKITRATTYTDAWKAFKKLFCYRHSDIANGVGQYLNGMAHTKGFESF